MLRAGDARTRLARLYLLLLGAGLLMEGTAELGLWRLPANAAPALLAAFPPDQAGKGTPAPVALCPATSSSNAAIARGSPISRERAAALSLNRRWASATAAARRTGSGQ